MARELVALLAVVLQAEEVGSVTARAMIWTGASDEETAIVIRNSFQGLSGNKERRQMSLGVVWNDHHHLNVVRAPFLVTIEGVRPMFDWIKVQQQWWR